MLQIVIILFVAYIVIPLVDLCLNERTRIPVKIGVYGVTFIWITYTLLVGRV